MIRVETFHGGAADAASFTRRVWATDYADRSFYALWDEPYFRWQLFDVPDPARVRRIGAYEGNRLVGFFAAEEFDFHTRAGPIRGTMSSWITVDSQYQRAGVGRLLRDDMWNWQRARGSRFMIGYVSAGSVRGKGKGFWTSMVPGSHLQTQPRFWIHIFDPAAAASSEFSWWEAAGVYAAYALQKSPLAEATGVRYLRAADLPQCIALAQAATSSSDFGYDWSTARAKHQLSFEDIPRTIVLDEGRGPEGFVNYYLLTLVGRSALRAAVVDFIVDQALDPLQARRLIRRSLSHMKTDGAQVALTLGPPVHGAATLLHGAFLPLPKMHSLIFIPVDANVRFPRARRMHLHWR